MRDLSVGLRKAGIRWAIIGRGETVSTEEEEEKEETPVLDGAKALTEDETQVIAVNFYRGLFGDHDMNRLLETVRIQREVLKILFSYWKNEPLRIVSTADAVRTSTLADLKKLAGLEAA